ncbi:MAG: glycoside hydrolase family 88 protein [Acidimicrobiia bacterium]|nr:MAG: glycoside hydrolase family 88 protein [Acidimicrobiia bacterium]
MKTENAKTNESALHHVLSCVRNNSETFGLEFPTRGYPIYETASNKVWVTGFWPGMLWLAYGRTRVARLATRAEALHRSFVERLDYSINLNHDVGFLYLLSCRAQWMATGDDGAHDTALRAARKLSDRYNSRGRYIQAFGTIDDSPRAGQMIIDCMMNLNLLYWATEQTDDPRYQEMAHNHAVTSQHHLVRDDGSTNHSFVFDPRSGEPLYARTIQGFSDDSLWARGQAWAIYGFSLSALWLDDPEFLETARMAADRFLAESPPDRIPMWDLRLGPDAPQYRDSSAAAIAVCGLFRLAKLIGSEHYRIQAEKLLETLIRECLETEVGRQGVLRHGAQHVPRNETIDGYLIYGDYFFLEALLTATGDFTDFWGPSS